MAGQHSAGNSYDQVPYLSAPFPQTSPARLRAIAHLFGLDAPDPATARVLELGCSAGGNLLPFAATHPGGTALGVDLSSVQVEAGRRLAAALGLDNLELRHLSIADIGPGLGTFDYIICHGVYSWVPPEVQSAILRVCSQNLAPDGVAYVSYNAYPGWKAKEIIRDAMLLRADPGRDAYENLAYARGMIDFMQEVARPGSVLQKVLEENIGTIRNGAPYYLIHEFLESCNAPCYFSEFLDRAGQHGLCYLGEADFCSMFATNFAADKAEALVRECGHQERLEQMMDFLGNRAFRQTLLVHGQRRDARRFNLQADRIRALHVSGDFQPARADDGKPLADAVRAMRSGQLLDLRMPGMRRLVDALAAAFPGSVPVAGLASGADGEQVLRLVDALLVRGAIGAHVTPVPAATRLERPVAMPALRALVAQLDAGQSLPVLPFNRNHEVLPQLGVVARTLVPLLDGTRGLAELEAAVAAEVERGKIVFQRDGKPVEDPAGRAAEVRAHVRSTLEELRYHAALEPDAAA